MTRMFRDEDQRYTDEGLRLDQRLTREFEATMLKEMEAGASLNELELLMIRAVVDAAIAIRLDYDKHVAHRDQHIAREQ